MSHPDKPKLPRISERDFQKQVVTMARLLGWWVYHTHDSRRSEPGLPDLILVHERRGVVWAELKRQGGRLRPEQAECLDRLRAAGQRAFLWTPDDWTTIEETLGVPKRQGG